ncbi:MAG: radical SAM protein [Archaeoglobus sp.]|uniref:SPL family radical SAM protein n=1 Tax=Archaeoglobus sp. TaxID=1872626 RepID=UPI001DA5D418|nr:radical SAM protein [Archaeoglobus sp.]MBO8180169.1 radical SAM protein [Archaeoglobus sp.]
MGVRVIRKSVRRALSRSNLPGVDFTINPYTGCTHGCIYCYARSYCQKEVGENWGSVVIVKENIPEVLGKELRRRPSGRVVLSTMTDPYQPLEKEEELTRRILEILLINGCKVGIQTKSDLVLRDMDLLSQNLNLVDVGFTITMLDKDFARKIEPYAPSPQRRIRALERLSDEGVRTWIFMGPVIPGVDEKEIEEIVEIAGKTSSSLYYDKFRVKGFMKSGFVAEMAEKAAKTDWKELSQRINKICEKYGVKAIPAFGNV